MLGCDLPELPENGKYTLLGKTPQSGSRVTIGTFIKYECTNASTNATPDVNKISYCQDDGEWSEIEPCPLRE